MTEDKRPHINLHVEATNYEIVVPALNIMSPRFSSILYTAEHLTDYIKRNYPILVTQVIYNTEYDYWQVKIFNIKEGWEIINKLHPEYMDDDGEIS